MVENRPGANTRIGMQACAAAAPDGHTFCITTNDSLSVNPHLFAKLPYNAAAAARATLAGPVDLTYLAIGPLKAHIDAGKLVPLAAPACSAAPGCLTYQPSGRWGWATISSAPVLNIKSVSG